ncbi:hypothetical protein M501DRAFT_967532 [Patellaria atrata CBS 101060]|uniref:DUF7708 domain-containing protein n=1 Tax=Patellaria atrata CBS 101060 TaxID=1346257 RepID=A0A9P4VW62_9PEZI|nr:hypothetical protein M501DRAFT_967532 [Patellaria atrata CBS 101060]
MNMSNSIPQPDEDEETLEIEGREIVRQFSDQLKSKHPDPSILQQALIQSMEEDEVLQTNSNRRRDLFQSAEDGGHGFDLVTVECNLVRDAWSEFISQLPEEDSRSRKQWSRNKRSTKVDQELRALKASTLADVLTEVNKAQEAWEEKDRLMGGKIQDGFHKVCASINDHQAILDAVPSQNDYTSTLCGSVRMLVKASVRHVKYAEDLAKALEEVSDEMNQVIMLVSIMNVKELRKKVANLYVNLFHFFRSSINWFNAGSWTKIRNGLNEGFYDAMCSEIQAIRVLSDHIFRDAQARGIVENREHRLISEQTYVGVQQITSQINTVTLSQWRHIEILREENRREREERQREREELEKMIKQLGDRMADDLVTIFKDQRNQPLALKNNIGPQSEHLLIESSPSPDPHDYTSGTLTLDFITVPPGTKTCYHRNDMLAYSSHLDDSITGFTSTALATRRRPSMASKAVVDALSSWIRAPKSRRLWIFGSPASTMPSTMAGATTAVIQSAHDLAIPCIAHACDRPARKPRRQTREEAGLIGLVYSFIRQLIAGLPDDFESENDLGAERFEDLDGAVESWESALEVLETLLHLGNPLLLVLIDGLNMLDHGGGARYCEDLLSVLEDAMAWRTGSVKLLLTTAGASRTLRAFVDRKDMCFVEDETPRRQGSDVLGEEDVPFRLRGLYKGSTILEDGRGRTASPEREGG